MWRIINVEGDISKKAGSYTQDVSADISNTTLATTDIYGYEGRFYSPRSLILSGHPRLAPVLQFTIQVEADTAGVDIVELGIESSTDLFTWNILKNRTYKIAGSGVAHHCSIEFIDTTIAPGNGGLIYYRLWARTLVGTRSEMSSEEAFLIYTGFVR